MVTNYFFCSFIHSFIHWLIIRSNRKIKREMKKWKGQRKEIIKCKQYFFLLHVHNSKSVNAELNSPIISVAVKPRLSGTMKENMNLSLRHLKVILYHCLHMHMSMCKYSNESFHSHNHIYSDNNTHRPINTYTIANTHVHVQMFKCATHKCSLP